MSDDITGCKYKRVLLKISGEALSGDTAQGIDFAMLNHVVEEVKLVHAMGVQVCMVVGGGNIFRGVTGHKQGLDRATGDYMGMLATVINALALQNAMELHGVQCRVVSAISMPAIGEPYIRRRALSHMEKGRVVIFAAGTGNPFFTTDTGAALRASEMGCDLLLKATKVNGIYSEDPVHNKDAEFYSRLTYTEVFQRDLQIMDATAVTLTRENQIPIAVFSIYEKGGFAKVLKGDGTFTLISN